MRPNTTRAAAMLRRHVQALHAIGAPAGSLDTALENILPLMEAELFGTAADAKEHAAFANKHKEAKALRAYDTYLLLASLTTFSTHSDVLLLPVRDRLGLAGQPAVRRKLQQLLQFAARGVLANEGATHAHVMTFVYDRLRATERGWASRGEGQEPSAPETELHEALITEFALTLLSQRLRKGGMDLSERDTQQRLDPLVPLLMLALTCRHVPCITLALKCLTAIVQVGLPSMAAAAAESGETVTALLLRCPNTSTPVAQVRVARSSIVG
jgi:hypothetical protein